MGPPCSSCAGLQFASSTSPVSRRSGRAIPRGRSALHSPITIQTSCSLMVGWYAHHLPTMAQRFSTEVTLLGELVVPWLAFAPRPARGFAFCVLSGLQAAIAATGNYGFFNLLTEVINLWLLDDEMLGRGRPVDVNIVKANNAHSACDGRSGRLRALRAHVGGASRSVRTAKAAPPAPPRARVDAACSFDQPYGLFSVMTVRRPEIVDRGIERRRHMAASTASATSRRDPEIRLPRWVAPHQPRLDWQMWFAALGAPPAWFVHLLRRLLEGSPEVIALFEHCPFPDRPPRSSEPCFTNIK